MFNDTTCLRTAISVNFIDDILDRAVLMRRYRGSSITLQVGGIDE